MYVCVYVCMYVCIYVFMHVYIYVCMYICMYVCMYVCMFVCLFVWFPKQLVCKGPIYLFGQVSGLRDPKSVARAFFEHFVHKTLRQIDLIAVSAFPGASAWPWQICLMPFCLSTSLIRFIVTEIVGTI